MKPIDLDAERRPMYELPETTPITEDTLMWLMPSTSSRAVKIPEELRADVLSGRFTDTADVARVYEDGSGSWLVYASGRPPLLVLPVDYVGPAVPGVTTWQLNDLPLSVAQTFKKPVQQVFWLPAWWWPVQEIDLPGDGLAMETVLEVAALQLRELPVVPIAFGGWLYIGLTVMGQNLSWELAEAFVRLGFRPPLSLLTADPPGGWSKSRQMVARAGMNAAQAVTAEIARTGQFLGELVERHG